MTSLGSAQGGADLAVPFPQVVGDGTRVVRDGCKTVNKSDRYYQEELLPRNIAGDSTVSWGGACTGSIVSKGCH
jgi:hypothetical protein